MRGELLDALNAQPGHAWAACTVWLETARGAAVPHCDLATRCLTARAGAPRTRWPIRGSSSTSANRPPTPSTARSASSAAHARRLLPVRRLVRAAVQRRIRGAALPVAGRRQPDHGRRRDWFGLRAGAARRPPPGAGRPVRATEQAKHHGVCAGARRVQHRCLAPTAEPAAYQALTRVAYVRLSFRAGCA